MHFDGKEYPGIHMMTGPNHEAYFQKHFIDFIREQGEPRFYLVKNNGFLLAEVDDLVFAVAPFLPEPSTEDSGGKMSLFKISFVTTDGEKLKFDTYRADYIKETPTGYALMDDTGYIVYTVPAGLIVEQLDTED